MLIFRYGLLYRKGEAQGTNLLNNIDLPTWQLAVTILVLVFLVITFLILLYEFYSVMGKWVWGEVFVKLSNIIHKMVLMLLNL